jgi:hypothetical protein
MRTAPLVLVVLFLGAASVALRAGEAAAGAGETDYDKGLLGLTFKSASEADPLYKKIEESVQKSVMLAYRTPLIAHMRLTESEKTGAELQKEAEAKNAGWTVDVLGTFSIRTKKKNPDGSTAFTVLCQLEQTVSLFEKKSWKAVLNKQKPPPIMVEEAGPVGMRNPAADALHEALVPLKITGIKKIQGSGGAGRLTIYHYEVTFTATNRLPVAIESVYPLMFSAPKKPGAQPGLQQINATQVVPLPLQPGASGTFTGLVEGYLVDGVVAWPPTRVVSSTTTKF